MPDANTPPEGHDRSYRRFYSHAQIVEDTLRGFVDQPWVRDLDFSTLKQLSEIFVGAGLEKREADSVWQVQWKGRPVYVYLTFEFQSKPLWYMAIKVWALVGLLYLRLIDAGVLPQGKLPAVIPIVVYNGKAEWEVAREAADLVEALPGLEGLRPQCSYLLLDLHRIPITELEGMDRPVAVLFQLEQSQGPEDIVTGIRRLITLLPKGHPLRPIFGTWLRWMVLPIKAPGIDIPEMNDLEEIEAMLAESVQEWTEAWKIAGLKQGREEGREQGREQGREEGRKQGREEGREQGREQGRQFQATMVLRQLELKFGSLPADVRARVEAASTDQLLKWGEQLLAADHLDDLFQPS